MSHYFSQLIQQTGISFNADTRGFAVPGVIESENSPLDDLDASIPGEGLREIEVASNDLWQLSPQPGLISDASQATVKFQQNPPDLRQESAATTQLLPTGVQSFVEMEAVREAYPVVEQASIEMRSPFSPAETAEIQLAEPQTGIAQPLFPSLTEPIRGQTVSPAQSDGRSPVGDHQTPAVESSTQDRLTQQQLGWQAVRGWLTGTPTVEQVLPTESRDRDSELQHNFNQLPEPTSSDAPAIPALQPRQIDLSEPTSAQTQDFTLAIGSISLTVETPPSQHDYPPVPPPIPSPTSPPPFSSHVRLSRYYLRVR